MADRALEGSFGWASADRSWYIQIVEEGPSFADPPLTQCLIPNLQQFLEVVRRARIPAVSAQRDGGGSFVLLKGLESTDVCERLTVVLRHYYGKLGDRDIRWEYSREVLPRRARPSRRHRRR